MSHTHPDRLGPIFTVICTLILVVLLCALAFGAVTTEGVPEFPFKNTAQTGGVPGWTQTGVASSTCAGIVVFLLQFTNPEGQLIQIFSDAEKKIVGAWYPDGHSAYPTHIWLGVIHAENGKITMGAPVPFDRETFPSPCAYWRGETGA